MESININNRPSGTSPNVAPDSNEENSGNLILDLKTNISKLRSDVADEKLDIGPDRDPFGIKFFGEEGFNFYNEQAGSNKRIFIPPEDKSPPAIDISPEEERSRPNRVDRHNIIEVDPVDEAFPGAEKDYQDYLKLVNPNGF